MQRTALGRTFVSEEKKHCIPLINPPHQITHIAFPTCNLKKPPSLCLGTFPPQQHQGSPPLPGLGLGPHQHLLHFLEPEPLQKADICKFHLHNRNIKQKEEEKTGSEIVERRNDGCRMLEVWLPGNHLGYRSNPDMLDISTRRSIASIWFEGGRGRG